MRKVGSLTGVEGATRGTRAVPLRVVLAGTLAVAVGLVIAAVSGAAGPTSSVSVFQQCANGAPPSSATDCPGGWINGILQANNSHYAEDEVTPQRVVVDLAKDSPLTGRSITISWLTRKGGVHAYDSLATWNHTQTSADRCAGLAAADCVGGAASTIAIPPDPTVVADSGGAGSATSGHQLSGQVFTLYGGTLTGVSAYTHDDPAGTSDEYAKVTVSYSVPSTTDGAKVMLLFGGHIAAGLGPRGWGPGLGAGSISGGPYHIKLVDLDNGAGNVGSQDNQIMSSAILAPANIVIKKTAVGGDATFDYTATGLSSPFSITTSSGTGQQNFTNLSAGSYTVTESTLPAGWDFSNLVCVDPTTNSSVDMNARKATINLSAGETVTCTYTNTKRGQIVVEKQTNPDGDAQLFTFAPSYGSSFQLSDGQTNTSAYLTPGTYSVSETVPAGWDQTSATCDDGSGPGSIGLSAGETVKCTFTNTKRGALVVIKHVVNDNGGTAVASAWSMHVKQGGSDISGSPFAGAESPGTSTVVTPGTYNVTESGGPSGYALTYSGDCDSSGNVTVPAGQTKTCTLTNDDMSPQVTVIKHVVKDNGGTAVASDWTMQIKQGATVVHSFAGAESPGTTRSVSVGSYKVVETGGPTGYALTYSGDCDSSGNVSVALGEHKTCTLTNDDQAATLIVKKIVVNDNGGTKTASDFSFQVNGGSAQSFEGDGQNDLSVAAGTYTVTEPAVAGYATSYSNCSNLVIPNGGTATCTITNNDVAATLTVVKHVVNDNGGSATAAGFTMTINGVTASGGNSFAGAESPGVTKTLTTVGSYNVSESSLAGYQQTSASADCSGSIALGEHKTCTIVNDDIGAKLIVIKHVVNDSGGSATSSDFSMSVDDAGTNPPSFPGAESPGTEVGVDPGAYSVSESGPAGYAASYSADCSGSIALGQTKTCTVTNNDVAGTLVVIKHVVNDDGGKASASDWTMNVAPGQLSFPGAESPGTSNPVDAGAYKVTESGGPSGYDLSYSGDCDSDGDVTVPLGQTRTCTLTNDDEAATLIVKKVVVNDNGGTKLASEFEFQVNGGEAQSFEADAQNDLTVDAGAYSVTEPAVDGYATSYDNCSELVIPNGGSETCTITNDDIPATLIVKKVVVNDNGGTKTASDFSFQVNGGSAQSFEADGQNDLSVNAGTYDVTEPGVAGYTTSYQGCANIVLPIGGSATCTVTNNDVPRGQGSISVSKSANPTTLKEPGGPVTFSVTITNTSADVDVTIDNVVDDKFGDLDDSGGNGCFDVPINLKPGEKVNCTFQKNITGQGGTSHVNVVTVSGHDENGHSLQASDDARVDITERLIDLVIVKEATSPTPLNGTVNYSLTVTNKGPDTATNVQLADPAPAGITYQSANPSQGSCSVTAALITCSLGSIAPGQTVTIAITGKATTVGQHTNTATVTGSGGRETNPADNVDSAVTIVPAPLKPPTPKPQPQPEFCLALTVSPKMIKADGKPDKVKVVVTAGKKRVKGVKVLVKGAGIKKTARTNGKGVAQIKINPKKAGLITVSVAESNKKLCGPARIGVVGVFLPPLTG